MARTWEDGPALARRIERAWASLGEASALAYGRHRPELAVAALPVAGGIAVSYGPGCPLSPMLSQAQGLGFDGPVAEEDLERLAAFYGDRGELSHSIEVATFADAGLLPALGHRGYRPSETTHMHIRPIRSEDSDFAVFEEGPSVSRVGGVHAAVFGDVVTRGFFDDAASVPSGLDDLVVAINAAEGASTWLAWVGAAPEPEAAGGASLFIREGLAMFAGDATLPRFRGRGVHDALVQARLAEAARLGCELAVVCTQPGGTSERNYLRRGFKPHHARILMVFSS